KSYPIVLVPGFLGWCTPFLGHYNYFGGFVNIAAILASQGWAVICPQIGPVSSNFERACEIYAQLTHGSCDGLAYDVPIDYGVPIHGTAVYYHPNPPLRKQAISFNLPKGWKWGADTPVHFVAHSQGGNTCRYLIHLLERGWCAEQSRYFTERKMGWVKSLTTLASPLNGSGIIDVLEDMGTAEDVLLDKIILAASYTRQDQRGFDFCLDHRGLCPPDQLPLLDGETAPDDLLQYMNYMSRPEGALAKWRESTYNGFYDNSIVGVVGDLNKIIGPPSQDVYYFTLSFVATVTVPE
ncbi:Alpha/Beta hydrolase protein, partial [Peziza echinospora]